MLSNRCSGLSSAKAQDYRALRSVAQLYCVPIPNLSAELSNHAATTMDFERYERGRWPARPPSKYNSRRPSSCCGYKALAASTDALWSLF